MARVASITGATPALASQYLTLAAGDENQAVILFFENGGVDLGTQDFPASNPPPPPPQASAPRVSSSSRSYQDARGVIHVDSDEEGDVVHMSDDEEPQITGAYQRHPPTSRSAQGTPPKNMQDAAFDADAALAARLQEEAYSGQEHGDEIRAPIARQAQTLLGPDADQAFDDSVLPTQIRRQMEAMQSRQASGKQ